MSQNEVPFLPEMLPTGLKTRILSSPAHGGGSSQKLHTSSPGDLTSDHSFGKHGDRRIN